jgi:hypothetical protein
MTCRLGVILLIYRKKGIKQEKLGNCVGGMESKRHSFTTYSQHKK